MIDQLDSIEGAIVLVIEDAISPREHGGGFAREIAKSVKKFEKEHGRKPTVILTRAQAEKLATESAEAAEQAAKEAAKAAAEAPSPAPEPEAPASAEPDPAFE